MKQHLSTYLAVLCATVLAVLSGGCNPNPPPSTFSEMPAGSFAQAWKATLELSRGDKIIDITPVGDLLIVRTQNNVAYAMSSGGGTLKWASQIVDRGRRLGAPVLAGERVVFPALDRLIVYSLAGKREREVPLNRAVRSPIIGDGEFIYVGFDLVGQGRLGRISLDAPYVPVRWELLTEGAISAAPGVFQDAIFAGSEDGNVYAISAQRTPLWTLPRNVFATGGPIVADVKVDDTGVYVASTDSKLYGLDRLTGKIRWQYYAGQSLNTPPLVTIDTVYQFVPSRGVVALEKVGGAYNREALWTADFVIEALAQDATFVFARGTDDSVIAIERKTGTPKFKTARTDLRHFAAAADGSIVFVATDNGTVLGIKPVTTGGTVGQLVQNEPQPEKSTNIGG